MKVKTTPQAQEKFKTYPAHVLPKLAGLRNLILEAAEETEGVDQLEETLKWGEPSYMTKHGSNFTNHLIRNNSGTAGHVSDQTQS